MSEKNKQQRKDSDIEIKTQKAVNMHKSNINNDEEYVENTKRTHDENIVQMKDYPGKENASDSKRTDLRNRDRDHEYIDMGISRDECRLLLEIEKVRGGVKETESHLRLEIEKIRAEIKDTEARIRSDFKDTDLKIEQVRAEIKDTEARIRSDLKDTDLKIEQVRAEIERSKTWIITWVVSTNTAFAALIIAAIIKLL